MVLVLISNKWLTIKTKTGEQRIKARNDYVRIEIETALKLRKPIMPILLNGASMPTKTQLLVSIARLATINAVGLSWFEGFATITSTIEEIEKQVEARKEKENEERNSVNLEFTNAPLTHDKKTFVKGVVVTAMEYSLERFGKKIVLDANDLNDILDQYEFTDVRKYGGFFFEDMIYVLDFIGIKAKRGSKRYVARSMPLRSITDIPAQSTLKRPVICGITVYGDWFDKKVSKTGMIDFAQPKSGTQGGVVGVIISWNPVNEQIKLLTPWPKWGNKGVATITKEAMYHIKAGSLRAVEAVEKLSPYSPSLRDLSNKMAAGDKKTKSRTK